jgi:hypothetical protein
MNQKIDYTPAPGLAAARAAIHRLQEFLYRELARIRQLSEIDEKAICVDDTGVYVPVWEKLPNGEEVMFYWTGEDATGDVHVVRQLALDLSRAVHRASKLNDELSPVAATARKIADSIDIDLIGWEPQLRLTLKRYIAEVSAIERNIDMAAAMCIGVPSEMHETAPGEGLAANERGIQAHRARSAGRLAAVAARFLSLSYRARYSEEFESELWTLAESGASRWQQIGHAWRLLFRAWHLRLELKKSQAKKAVH